MRIMKLCNTVFVLALLAAAALAELDAYYNRSRVNFLVPQSAVPGKSAVALINFHDNKRTEDVTLRLVRYAKRAQNGTLSVNQQTEILAQNTSSIRGSGAVKLDIPSKKIGVYELQILFDCGLWDENCSLQSSSPITLIGNIRDVIIRPSSNYYRPGERITFWILAIDQSLQAPTDVFGNIYIRNPSNVIIASWEDRALNENANEKYELVLSERAFLGKWTIEVIVKDGACFKVELNVSLSRGSNEPSRRDQVAAEKHFVELHFSDQMSISYKPGLPLIGKVVAASSENEVRIRVKIIDDQSMVLYSQDIDMNGREGIFVVPAVITNTSKITAQAELVSLGGKDVDSQYILARKILYKWNSTSECYLLVKNVDSELMPNRNAEITVLSSCPLTADVHYVVTTEGRITAWGDIKLVNHSTVPVTIDNIMQGINICQFNITFGVLAEMAPLSRLLVYYSSKAGDIISDNIPIYVKLQEEEVSLILDQNGAWYVGESVKCGIISRKGSQVCLTGGRVEDNPMITRETILRELDIRISSMPNTINHQNNNDAFPTHYSFLPYTLIDRIWIWNCFHYTTSVKRNGVTLPSPEMAGKWKLWALSISELNGLSISEAAVIDVVAPITVNFQLPNIVKVMEIIQVEINIVNSVNSCVDVHAVIGLNEGMVYPGIETPVVSEKLRLGGNGATSVVVRIQPITAGHKTMNVIVNYYVRHGCQEVVYSNEEAEKNSSTENTIAKTESMQVLPEGIQRVQRQDAFFCANEYTLTIKSDDANFTFVSIPRNKYSAVMEIQAEGKVYVVLSEYKNVLNEMYQITIGDLDNRVSWIGHSTEGHTYQLVSVETERYLSSTEKRTFWLSWLDDVISIGRGRLVGNNTFLQHQLSKKIQINNIGFATNWGVKGTVILSIFSDESGFSQVIHMDVPNHILPGTEKGILVVTSGLNITSEILSVMQQPDIRPFSSIQSTMSSAALLYTLKYNKTEENLIQIGKNLQALLQYMKSDYSFSDHPNITDYRITLKAFEILSEARFYAKVNTDTVNEVYKWIIRHQTEDGSFSSSTEESLNEKIANTAETFSVLLFSQYVTTPKAVNVLKGAKQYLEKNFHLVNDSYTLAVTCYALTLGQSALHETVLEMLQAISKNEEGEFEWPHPDLTSYTSGSSEWYYEDEMISINKKNELMSAYISDYKASLYTLMVYCLKQDLEKATSVAQYIFYHSQILNQHPELSLLTLKAISEFIDLEPAPHSLLTMSLATSGMELTDTIELKENQNTILYPPTLPTKVFIYATGSGCSSVKGTVTYSTYAVSNAYGKFNLSSVIEEIIPAHYNSIGDPEGMFPTLRVKTCFRVNSKLRGARLEVDLFSGYNLVSVMSGPKQFVYGSYDNRVWFAFKFHETPMNCSVCVNYLVQSSFIITALRPMYAQVYDIDYPHIREEIFFHDLNRRGILVTDLTDKDFTVWFGNSREKSDSAVTECSNSMASAVNSSISSRTTVTQQKSARQDYYIFSTAGKNLVLNKTHDSIERIGNSSDPERQFTTITGSDLPLPTAVTTVSNSSTTATSKAAIPNNRTIQYSVVENSTLLMRSANNRTALRLLINTDIVDDRIARINRTSRTTFANFSENPLLSSARNNRTTNVSSMNVEADQANETSYGISNEQKWSSKDFKRAEIRAEIRTSPTTAAPGRNSTETTTYKQFTSRASSTTATTGASVIDKAGQTPSKIKLKHWKTISNKSIAIDRTTDRHHDQVAQTVLVKNENSSRITKRPLGYGGATTSSSGQEREASTRTIREPH